MKVILNNSTLTFRKANVVRHNVVMGYNFSSASLTDVDVLLTKSPSITTATDRGVFVIPIKTGDFVSCKNLVALSTSQNLFLVDTSFIVRSLIPIASTIEFTSTVDGFIIVGTAVSGNPYIDVSSTSSNNIEVYYQYETGKFINASGRVNSTSGTAMLNSPISLNNGDVLNVITNPLNGNVTSIGTTTDATVDDSTVYTVQSHPTGTDETLSSYTATATCKAMASSANPYIMALVVRNSN